MKISVLLSLSFLSTGTPVLAQFDPQVTDATRQSRATRMQPRNDSARAGTEPGDRAQAIRKMRGFAQCVVRGDSDTPRQLLETTAGSAEERAVMLKVAKKRSQCLGQGQLRMEGIMMRGALAEQLYLQAYPTPLTGAARPDAPIAASLPTSQPYHAYANCIVARNAPGADAVLRAAPGSDEEKSAYGQAMPTLSSCLAGEGKKLAIDRTTLRGFLAEALYASRNSAG